MLETTGESASGTDVILGTHGPVPIRTVLTALAMAWRRQITAKVDKPTEDFMVTVNRD